MPGGERAFGPAIQNVEDVSGRVVVRVRLRDLVAGEIVAVLRLLIERCGCGPRLVAFRDWVSCQDYVVNSGPGNRFLLWSIEEIDRCGMVLGLKRAGEAGSAGRIREALDHTFAYANNSGRDSVVREVFAIRIRHRSSMLECLLNDLNILDSLKEFLKEADTVSRSWYLVQFTEIDPQNALENARHLLVDAKRPDGQGAVPLGGYY